MNNKVKLVPGRSVKGDSNVIHPAGDILNLKEFYEQDSHVQPEGLMEVHASVTEGIDNVWWEYAPADLKADEHPPLILSFHGGGQKGWGQSYGSSWVLLADKYRFVTVFPTSSVGKAWIREKDSPDFAEVAEIIRQMKERYHIDEGRIYITGMGFGSMMASVLAKHWGIQFAGVGMTAGPEASDLARDPNLDFSAFVPIPVCASRGEYDSLNSPRPGLEEVITTRIDMNRYDRMFWRGVNGCAAFPSVIKIEGRNNYFVFKGEKADLIYRDVKARGHGQTIDDAEKMWRCCFSGTRRNPDGTLSFSEPLEKLEGDKAVIIADGFAHAIFNGVKKPLECAVYQVEEDMTIPERMKDTMAPVHYGPFTYAPVSFFEQAFGFTAEYTYEGHGALLTSADGKTTVEVAEGNVACLVNDVLMNMERQAEYKDGVLYIPVGDFAERLGLIVIEQDGVVYITDHTGSMTKETALILKQLLG